MVLSYMVVAQWWRWPVVVGGGGGVTWLTRDS